MVREAHAQGANIVLIQELFEGHYFCQAQREDFFARAHPREGHPTIARMQSLAKELSVVIPVSFFEQANNAHYNSIVVVDADGADLGVYRKSHIPDGPGYQEKFYFNPGDTGFKFFKTKYATIGVAICWDQWFPECARAMALMGAEVLFYPTAIGSEPQDGDLDSSEHWRRVTQGHAGANLVPIVASNRVGAEVVETERGSSKISFYGTSFIAGPTGEIVASADEKSDAVIVAKFDLNKIKLKRHSWGVFRDRRPELYKVLLTSDGQVYRTSSDEWDSRVNIPAFSLLSFTESLRRCIDRELNIRDATVAINDSAVTVLLNLDTWKLFLLLSFFYVKDRYSFVKLRHKAEQSSIFICDEATCKDWS